MFVYVVNYYMEIGDVGDGGNSMIIFQRYYGLRYVMEVRNHVKTMF